MTERGWLNRLILDLADFSYFRLMREITEWFFESHLSSLQNQAEEEPANNGTAKEEVQISQVITLAVPILFEKVFGILDQLYIISEAKNLNIQPSVDGMKKSFASILQLYQTNCASTEIQWEGSPPIDKMVEMTKKIFVVEIADHIVKVNILIDPYYNAGDENLSAIDFGKWSKHESRLIFSLNRSVVCSTNVFT